MLQFNRIMLVTISVVISQNVFSLLLPFMVLKLTGSYESMALVRMIEYLPNIVLVFLIGFLVDKFGWYKNMWVSLSLQLLLMLLVFFVSSASDYFMMYLCYVFLFNSSAILFNNARVSFFKESIHDNNIEKANTYLLVLFQSSQIAAPVILTGAFALGGIYYGLAFCLFCLIMANLIFIKIKRGAGSKSDDGNGIKLKYDLLKFFKQHNYLLYLSLVAAIVNGVESAQIVLFVFKSKTEFLLSDITVGLIFSMIAAVVVVVSIALNKYKNALNYKRIFSLLMFLSAIAYLLSFFWGNIIFICMALLLSNITFACVAIYIWSYRQKVTPVEILGKVTSITSMIFKLGIPLMMLCSYLLSLVVSNTANYLVFALLCFAVGCFFLHNKHKMVAKI